MGATITFVAWIWVSALVILLDAGFTAEIERQAAIDTPTGPLAERGARKADTAGAAFNGFSFFRHKRPKRLWSILRQTSP